VTARTYTVLHLAAGLGGCALGFQAARAAGEVSDGGR